MYSFKSLYFTIFFISLVLCQDVMASSTMTDDEVQNIQRAAIEGDEDRKRLQQAAVLLAHYEIEARKIIKRIDAGATGEIISEQAKKLLNLSEGVISSAQFRLPQCDAYLAKTMALKNSLQEISHETLEKDYHQDGALPAAPAECYHAKDLFVHPASVIVLIRDDPALGNTTKSSIKSEITEILVHTEVVRQLVFY